MNYVTEPERRTGILCEAEVVVPGAGPAVIAVDRVAARQGHPTGLLKRLGNAIRQTGAKAD